MKAKVKLTDTYTSRSINIITDLMNTYGDIYEFSFEMLSDRQHDKIEKFFGKMAAYYTKADILRVYNNKN